MFFGRIGGTGLLDRVATILTPLKWAGERTRPEDQPQTIRGHVPTCSFSRGIFTVISGFGPARLSPEAFGRHFPDESGFDDAGQIEPETTGLIHQVGA